MKKPKIALVMGATVLWFPCLAHANDGLSTAALIYFNYCAFVAVITPMLSVTALLIKFRLKKNYVRSLLRWCSILFVITSLPFLVVPVTALYAGILSLFIEINTGHMVAKLYLLVIVHLILFFAAIYAAFKTKSVAVGDSHNKSSHSAS